MRLASTAAAMFLFAAPAFATGWFEELDCKYTATRRAETSAAGITRIVIRAESGSLEVNGTQGATQILATGTACTSDEDFLPRITATLRKVGSELHIDADIPEKTVIFGFFSARLDLNITVPAGIAVTVEDESGSIRVANTGATRIEDGSGSIEVRNVRGPLTIRDQSGSIDVDLVIGDVEIEDDSGELTVRNVTGNVEIEDDSGAITVVAITGSVRVREDDSGSIDIRNVRRDVTIGEDTSGSVEVSDVGGNFTLGRKGSGHVSHERVSGRVTLPAGD